MELVEKRLAARARTGDREAFEELVEIYKDKIVQLGYRMLGNKHEAEEVAQETFIRVYVNLNKYDATHKFSTWIYRIASNICIDRIRKRRHAYSLDAEIHQDGEQNLYAALPDTSKSPEEQAVLGEMQVAVHDAVMSLNPTYRTVMVLRYFHDMSLQEISDVTNLPVSTIKTRIHRGREALRKKLSDIS